MVVLAFMIACIHVVSLQAALHPRANFGKPMVTVMFVFFALIGNVLGKTRRNFYMGYRCPWTLASDTVWVATHRLGGKLMFATGITGAIAICLGVPLPVCFVLFLIAVAIPYPYALMLYKKLESEGKAPDADATEA
jgi:uncharacterized membrane protein